MLQQIDLKNENDSVAMQFTSKTRIGPRKYKILHELKSRLLDNVPEAGVEKVILFGSRATGKARKDSDYDFLIVIKNEYDWQLARRIRAECFDLGIVYDFVPDVKILSLSEQQSLRGHQPFILSALESVVWA